MAMRLSKDDWERQYRKGKWSYLATEQEAERYAQLGKYLNAFCPRGKVLDVGCGFGLLAEGLKEQQYLGIDFSTAALSRAPQVEKKKVSFECFSAEAFTTEEQFDVIVFNEVLYYFQEPAEVLDKYETMLKPQGYFIFSLWKHPKTVLLWEWLQKRYVLKEAAEACHTDSGNAWLIGVFQLQEK